jgi:hypothetical protein
LVLTRRAGSGANGTLHRGIVWHVLLKNDRVVQLVAYADLVAPDPRGRLVAGIEVGPMHIDGVAGVPSDRRIDGDVLNLQVRLGGKRREHDEIARIIRLSGAG